MKIRVNNGKYTFVNRPNAGYIIDVLRHGEEWAKELDASYAIQSMMAELDAARLVLQVVREISSNLEKIGSVDGSVGYPAAELKDALAKHSRLVDDREPPSEWTK